MLLFKIQFVHLCYIKKEYRGRLLLYSVISYCVVNQGHGGIAIIEGAGEKCLEGDFPPKFSTFWVLTKQGSIFLCNSF